MEIDINAHIPHPELFSTVKARSERFAAAMRDALAELPARPWVAREILEKALAAQ